MENPDSYDDSMPVAFAEDLAGLAAHGRLQISGQYIRNDFERAILDRGPVIAQVDVTENKYRNDRSKWAERRIFAGGDTLRITIGPDLTTNLANAAATRTQEVLALATTSDFEVSGLDISELDAESYPDIGRISLGDTRDGVIPVELVRKSSRLGTGIFSENVDLFAGLLSEGTPASRRLIISALLAHDQLGGHLFVTLDKDLLSLRYTRRGNFARLGIVSPGEAVQIAYAILRGRRKFYLFLDADSQYTINGGLYYNHLAAAHIPSTLSAFRSLLSPSSRSTGRKSADYLESAMARYFDLLMLADDLGRFKLLEGERGGDNDILALQLIAVQNSLVLYTGALDACAWVVACLDSRPKKNNLVSWNRMIRADGEPFVHMSATPTALQESARAIDTVWPRLVFGLRDAYQHRGRVVGSVARMCDPNRVVHARYSLIDLRSSGEQSPVLPSGLYGTFRDGNVQPHIFQHGLVRSLASILESVFSSVPWPASDWYINEPTAKPLVAPLGRVEADCVRQWWW